MTSRLALRRALGAERDAAPARRTRGAGAAFARPANGARLAPGDRVTLSPATPPPSGKAAARAAAAPLRPRTPFVAEVA